MLNVTFIEMYSLMLLRWCFYIKIVVEFGLVHSVLLMENEFNCGNVCTYIIEPPCSIITRNLLVR
jgi:hypothetical protein